LLGHFLIRFFRFRFARELCFHLFVAFIILIGDLPVKVAQDFAAMGGQESGVRFGVQHFNRKRTIRTLGA
jgi:hypothetical protein